MVVHSKDDKEQRKTKLERIGELAAQRSGTVFNNLGHVIDQKLLGECYQRLDGKKAIGIDKITKESYGSNLGDNLQDLLKRIRKGAYKPQPSKIVEIPKEDGSLRPLAISCFEDKIIQMAVAQILSKIFEPLFLPCSYGYREGINGHEALRMLMKHSNQNSQGATIEIDLQKYFNSIPHEVLMEMLQEKISDKRFLALVYKLIRAPTLEEGKAKLTKKGCPQGSIVAPILANIYLHYVIDEWFEKIRKSHIKGSAELIRFADDMVFVFQNHAEAERFYQVLPKRLKKYGLDLHESKSGLLHSGSQAAAEAHSKGERLSTYKFLGFVCYWGQSRNGNWRLKYKSRSDRRTAKLNGLRQHLKRSLKTETQEVIAQIARVVKGWVNYHAISDNQRCVNSFIYLVERILFKWVNRKGGKRKMNWNNFGKLLKMMKFPRNYRVVSMFTS
jgi:group II intron reverse transcriptase/maturase